MPAPDRIGFGKSFVIPEPGEVSRMVEHRGTCWAFLPSLMGRDRAHGAGRDLRDGMTAQRAATLGSEIGTGSGLVA